MLTQHSQSTVGSVTVAGRLMRTRALLAYALLVIAAPPLVGVAAWQTYACTTLPDVGLAVDGRLEVEGVDARWPGVERGDRITALDGQELADSEEWVTRALRPRSGPLRVTFMRDGRSWSESAEQTPMRLVDEVALWARVVTGALLIAMGLVAFLLRPGVTVTWLLVLLAWDLGAFLLLKPALYFDPSLSKRASGWAFILGVALGLHFMSYFPQKLPWVAANPKRAAWLYGAPIVGVPVMLTAGLSGPVTAVGTLTGAVACVVVVMLLALQYRSVRTSRDAAARSQYRALLVGFTLGLGVPGVWNWLRLGLGVGAGPWTANYNALPLVLFVGVTAYAVVRHNALAIDKFTAGVVGYGVTVAVLGGAFAAALVGLPLVLDRAGLGSSRVWLVSVTALTFASIAPVYRRIKRWVDRRFFRERADAAQMAEALRDLLVTMQRSTRDEAIASALRAAGILQGERQALWLLSKEDNRLVPCHGAAEGAPDEAVMLDGPLGQALQSGQTAGVEGLAPRLMDTAAQEELWSNQFAMAAPVMVHGVVAGFVGVGRKRSGGGYQPEEMSFLSIVGAQLGSALERSQTDSARLDRYHLERRLGTGGMAEVYLAWQVGPGGFERKVAVKRPLPHVCEDPNAVASFLDEARLAAQLRHANIAQVYDVGESDGSYFIVMEYVDGPSLRQILRALEQVSERVPLTIALGIVTAVLGALGHAHAHRDAHDRPLGLVHRDVTPRNVLLNRRGEAKLVDFGIARAQHQLHVTRTGTVKGTLPYMSPEQASGGVIDQRSDIYSAAALLYELVTGEKAFPDGPLRPRPRPASAVEPSLPVALDPVLSRALSFEAADRYETAAGFAKALRLTIHPREVAASETIATWLQQTPWETDAATASSVSVSATEAPRSASGSSEIATVIEDRNQQTAATVLVGRRTRDDDSRS